MEQSFTCHGDKSRPSIEFLIQEWLRQDRCKSTRNIVESSQVSEKIDHWFYPRITFGTAGLRAQVGPGYARMNNLVVLQTTLGLARWISRQTKERPNEFSVVIGFDGRTNSMEFAELAASAMLFMGIKVLWLGKLVHTPLVAFSVKEKKANAGIMITASHNPKEDNGYKVYAGNGCQINTPVDAEIQSAILEDFEVPEQVWDVSQVNALSRIGDEMQALYIAAIQSAIGVIENSAKFVYTPLHGIGLEIFTRVFQSITLTDESSVQRLFQSVSQQSIPDPEFPTVKYPNPEEDGALNLAQILADKNGISLIIANDPDADRLAVAEKVSSGSWYQFKGDEVGALLGWYIFMKHRKSGEGKPVMFNSAVSSSFLSSIGSHEGFEVRETLTGFKWIGNMALNAENHGDNVLYGYEEALGYMLPNICYDKDGVSTAMLFLQATTIWSEELNQTPIQVLQHLYEKYGWHETANTYFKSPDVKLTNQVFKTIQTDPSRVLVVLPPGTQIRIRDALQGTDSGEVDGKSQVPVVEGNLMVTCWLKGHPSLGEGTRVTIRASGTEPKVKIYVECKDRTSKDAARNGALMVLRAVTRTWFQDSRFMIEERWKNIVLEDDRASN